MAIRVSWTNWAFLHPLGGGLTRLGYWIHGSRSLGERRGGHRRGQINVNFVERLIIDNWFDVLSPIMTNFHQPAIFTHHGNVEDATPIDIANETHAIGSPYLISNR